MPRIARITVTRDPRSPARPWVVNLPASLSASGTRERPHYATRGEAERMKSAEEQRLADYSRRALGLTDAQQIEAAECFTLIAPHSPRSLRDAVRLAVGVWDAETRSVPVEHLARAVEKAKEQDGASGDHTRTIRFVLAPFVRYFAGRAVASITAAEIDGWLRGRKKRDGQPFSPVSRNSYRRVVSLARSYAVTQGWARENIVAAVPQATETAEEVVFLLPDQVGAMLRASSPILVAHTALCALAGMRPKEAALLTWQDIGATEIRVRASIAKTRRHRLIPICDALREWLSCAARHPDGKIGWHRADHRAAAATAGLVPWPKDCLRHSYGTYRGTMIGENDLAREMGNSPEVIIQHYRGIADATEAARYFAIFPTDADRQKKHNYVPARSRKRGKRAEMIRP